MHRNRSALAALMALLAANCGGGSGGHQAPPATRAPVITYGSAPIILTVNTTATVMPTNTGAAATSWSISPGLPAGLTFSATSGGISGAPTAASRPTSYTVTATNAGGSATASLTLGVESVLVDLGHATHIQILGFSGSELFSMDTDAHWMLQDYASGKIIAEGLVPCTASTCNASVGPTPHVDAEIEGPTLVIQTTGSLATLSATDGAPLGTINTLPTWWHLASDGSYICGGTKTALTAWTPSGAMIASVSGDYSQALASCAPGVIRIADGPAGADVIQSISVPSGSSSVSPSFQGTFNTWFGDGSAFITNAGNTVWVYSNSGAQLDLAALPTSAGLAGEGPWFWTYQYTPSGVGTLDIYKVGSAAAGPAATFTYPLAQPPLVSSGPTIAVSDGTVLHQIDLAGATPTDTDYNIPVGKAADYAATSASHWVVANGYGAILDGSSISITPRYLDYGEAWSIAGSAPLAAVATASGTTLLFDTSTWSLEGTLNSANSQIALSADGTIMAARAAGEEGGAGDDSVTTYSLPSGSVIHTWPYTYDSSPNPWAVDISLSRSGALLGQVVYSGNSLSETYTRMVTSSSGGSTLWSDSVSRINPFLPGTWPLPILLSADDTLIAVSSSKDGNAGTDIYLNDSLASAAAGWAVAWLPNDELLVNKYAGTGSNPPAYQGSALYSSTGTPLSSPPLPELGKGGAAQAISADSVYDPWTNRIYSLTSGSATWSGPQSTPVQPYGGLGAIAGPRVVFELGSQILTLPY